jgi:hypothetical protein
LAIDTVILFFDKKYMPLYACSKQCCSREKIRRQETEANYKPATNSAQASARFWRAHGQEGVSGRCGQYRLFSTGLDPACAGRRHGAQSDASLVQGPGSIGVAVARIIDDVIDGIARDRLNLVGSSITRRR